MATTVLPRPAAKVAPRGLCSGRRERCPACPIGGPICPACKGKGSLLYLKIMPGRTR